MATLLHDLRYASRVLLRAPVFTAVAVLTLAIGIGLNTAVFSAVEAMILRPLPGIRDDASLVQVFRSWPGSVRYGASSIPHYFDLRERADDVFSGVLAWSFVPVNVAADGRTEQVLGQMVSANFFSVLGVQPVRGRAFVPDEDVGPGTHPVAVVSDGTWRSLFGGDPDVVGRTVTLNGQPFTIVGVAPPEFRGPVPLVSPALWVPLMMQREIMPGPNRIESRGSSFLNVVARLRPGVTIDQARDRMDAVWASLREEHPDHYAEGSILLIPQREAGIHPNFRTAQVGLSTVVMAVVVMLLLIACVNVANLFLARARSRTREMAVRLSIGASRGRILRQLLTESILLSLVAGAAGLLLAWWVIGLANGMRPPMDVPFDPDLRLGAPVLTYTLTVALLTGIVFGLAPALQSTRPEVIAALKGETPGGASRSRMSRSLVVAQMALSLILLVGAGLFLRNLREAMRLDVGFQPEGLLLASVDPGLQGYDRARTEAFYARLLERLRAVPGVDAAAVGEMVPLGLGSQQRGVDVPGYEPRDHEGMSIDYNIVGPGYFEAMGIPILRGRGFTARDDTAATGALVVNERFAERYWGNDPALGNRVRMDGREWEIVGIVPNGRYRTLGEDPLPYMYIPQAQLWNSAMTVHVRTGGDPNRIVPHLRAAVAELDAALPVTDIRTGERHLGFSQLPARVTGSVLGIFGLLGLLLAAVGLYGVMAYSVAQRTREIGIRMAVGAAAREVVWLVLRQGLRLVAIGAAIGLVGAIAASRFIRGLLYGDGGVNPALFAAVTLVLGGVAALAIWIPARRAAEVDPMEALRAE